ncbi:MAG: hypothetical protein RLZ65_1010 [Actinomycetota bacterium]
MNLTPKSLFRMFAVAEVVTWALLISALIIRATLGLGSEVFFVVGASHGFTFLGYGVTAVLVGINQRWSIGRLVLGVVLAIVPFATVPFDRSVERRGLLEGQWRVTKSDDPRDSNWFDALFRWFIARPILLVLVLVAFVVSLFSFLLFLGPPSEWGK